MSFKHMVLLRIDTVRKVRYGIEVQHIPMSLLIFLRTAILFTMMLTSTLAFRQTMRFSSSRSLSMALKEGDAVPNVVFKARVRDEKIGGTNPFTWKDVSTSDLFKGKRAVLFSLPGGGLIFQFLCPPICFNIISVYLQPLHRLALLLTCLDTRSTMVNLLHKIFYYKQYLQM